VKINISGKLVERTKYLREKKTCRQYFFRICQNLTPSKYFYSQNGPLFSYVAFRFCLFL
jgi:hypothetical protein